MGDVFISQDIRIRRKVMRDLSGVSNPRIYYKKPDGTIGFWVATVDGRDMYYDLPAAANTTAGLWHFWVYYEQGLKKYTGTITKKYINAI